MTTTWLARGAAMPDQINVGRFVTFSSLFSIAVGMMGLVGCIFHVQILRTIVPGFVAIAANSSVCLILLGVSLWCLRERDGVTATTAAKWLGTLAAGVAGFIGLLSLIEFLGNLNLGIDQLLFTEIEVAGHIRPGLMSPVTALDLLLLGLALVSLDWTFRRSWPSQVLSSIAGIVAVFTLLDMIANPRHFRAHISLPTVAVLSAFPFAVICARPKRAVGGLLMASLPRRVLLKRLLFPSPLLEGARGEFPHYALAVLLVAAATVLRHLLDGYLSSGLIFITYYPAVMVAALMGGLGPGILATVLSATCANYFFLPPVGVFTIASGSDLLGLLMFSAIALAICWLASAVERTREEASEETRRAQEEWELTFDSVPDAVMVLDQEFRIQRANQAMCALVELSAEAIVGKHCYELVHQQTASVADCPLKEMLQAGREEKAEIMEERSGKVFEVSATSLREKGCLRGCLHVMRDVTERRRAEAELRESEERYRSVVSAMAEGVVLQDATGKIIACNGPAERILGRPSNRMKGLTSDDWQNTAIHEDGSPFPGVTHPAMVSLRTGKPQSNVCMGLCKPDRSITWILINSEPMFHDGEAAPYAVVTTFADITHRKEAEESRRRSEAKLRLQFERMPIGCVTWDKDFRVQSWNPAATTIFGFTREEASGRHPYEFLVPKEAQPAIDDIFTRLSQGDTTAHSINENLTKDGRTIVCRWTNTPVRDDRGQFVSILSMVEDITATKEAEDTLRRQAALIDLAHDAIFVRDMEGRVVSWSRGAERTYGWTPQDAIGQTSHSMLKTQFPVPREAIEALLRQQGFWEGELVHTTHDGSTITVDSRWSLQSDETGTPMAVLEVNRDVTARMKAEAAILAERQKMNTILDSVPPYVCLLTPDYHVGFANLEFRRRFGEHKGRKCYEFLFNRNDPCEICETYKVLTDDRPRNWQWTGPDGCRYDIFDFPFTDTDGSKLILEMGIDVTEQWQAEEKLRRSEAELKEAHRVARLGNWTLDTKTGKVTWSDGLFRMFGLEPSAEAPPYSAHQQLFTAESWQRLAPAVDKTAQTGEPYELELETILPDGHHGWILARGEALRNNGNIRELRGIALDITERKRIDAALRDREEKLRLAMAAGKMGAWDLDLFNDRAWRSIEHDQIFGYDTVLPEWGAQIFFEHVLPEDREMVKGKFEEAYRTGFLKLECRILRKDNTVRWIAPEGQVSYDAHGKPIRMSGIIADITERKRSEAALRESEQKFSSLADFVPQFVWMCTPDGLNFYFNQRWFEYTGLTKEESHGRGWNTPFHPDDKQVAWDAWDHAVATGEAYQVESRLRAADGSYRWFLMRGMPLRDDSGNITRWFGTSTDIHDMKQGEAELSRLNQELEDRVRRRTAQLEAANARLGVAQRAAMAGMWNWDLIAGKFTWSQELYDLFGLASTEQASLETWKRVVHPQDWKGAFANVERAVKDHKALENEYRIVLTGGQERWIRAVGNTTYDKDGTPQNMSGICLDITDRKRAEQALRDSELRVRRKLDSILLPEGDLGNLELADILDISAIQSLLDDFHSVVHVTTALIDLRGKILAVAGWRSICQEFHRVHPECGKFCIESDRELSTGIAEGEFKIYKCKNHMWDVATPIVVGGKHLGNLFCGQFFFEGEQIDYEGFRAQARQYGFDEKKYMAALDQVPILTREQINASMTFLAKLAKMISQLSYSSIKLARSTEQVNRANSELQATVKELESFTYSVSHDLRAPLRHISGFSKILAEDFGSSLPEEAQHHLNRIAEGTRRMGMLVDDLLNLARIGRRELNTQVCGLRYIVDEVLHDLQPEYERRNVEWKIGELPFVECDPRLMKQVLLNLVSNALKYTRPRAQAVIEIGQEKQRGALVIFVRDNGVGFNMKYADKLFGVFQRLHRAEDFEGTGVGLATVQRIIHKHGGRIWPQAEVDKGATFYFTLGHSETEAAESGAATAQEDEYASKAN